MPPGPEELSHKSTVLVFNLIPLEFRLLMGINLDTTEFLFPGFTLQKVGS